CDNMLHPLSTIEHIPIFRLCQIAVERSPAGGRGRLREGFMFRRIFRALTIAAVVVATTGFLASGADARIGGGLSSGSRGTRTFSAPPSTSTMPSASPMERTVTQPNFTNPRPGFAPSPGGFFGRSGFWGGLAAGFLGAGLFGLLFGH